uniref:Uncharacterized protein n=1 Tax=Rangifer tarandus platyrhynchus TaxID=3082113 RepID=A0ACB0EIK5_RANTA|nr:unnamed protein product [Rangifer tarandus platyrhynchus]
MRTCFLHDFIPWSCFLQAFPFRAPCRPASSLVSPHREVLTFRVAPPAGSPPACPAGLPRPALVHGVRSPAGVAVGPSEACVRAAARYHGPRGRLWTSRPSGLMDKALAS